MRAENHFTIIIVIIIIILGWLGETKVSCSLRHWGVLLAYSWAMPALLVAGKGRGGGCFYFISTHFLFLSRPSLSSHLLSILSLFSLSPGDDTK